MSNIFSSKKNGASLRCHPPVSGWWHLAPCPGDTQPPAAQPSPAHGCACKMSTALPPCCSQLLLGNCLKSKRQHRMRGEQPLKDGRLEAGGRGGERGRAARGPREKKERGMGWELVLTFTTEQQLPALCRPAFC